MSLIELIRRTEFCDVLIRFLSTFNSDIDWRVEINNWINKGRRENSIMERIRAICWIDKRTVDYSNEEYRAFSYCNKTLHKLGLVGKDSEKDRDSEKDKDKDDKKDIDSEKDRDVYILSFDRAKCTAKMEQFFDLYIDTICSLFSMREIPYKLISQSALKTVPKRATLLDVGWLFLDEDSLSIISSIRTIHFPLFNLSYLYAEFIPMLLNIYVFITDDRNK